MTWTPLVYLGRVSYGLYVYHPFVPPVFRWAGIGVTGAVGFLIGAALTVGVASLSWFAFEHPLNSLKRHFRDPR